MESPAASPMPRSATNPKMEIARLAQALEDLVACETQSISLIHCPSSARERALVKELAKRARTRGYVTADVSLREHGLESPDGLVREILSRLIPPREDRAQGLLKLLDKFKKQNGAAAADNFDKAA